MLSMIPRLSLLSVFSPLLKAPLLHSAIACTKLKQLGGDILASKSLIYAVSSQTRSFSESIDSNSTSSVPVFPPFSEDHNYIGLLYEWRQKPHANGTFQTSFKAIGEGPFLWLCTLVVTTPQGSKTFSEMNVVKKKAMKMAAHKACIELGLLNAW
ncbi:hypothetical protein JCM3765_003873 [Sporobolomyces pararoseus]